MANTIRRIILKYWCLLQEVSRCNRNPQVGFRRIRSLKNFLGEIRHIYLKKPRGPSTVGHFKCGNCSVVRSQWKQKYSNIEDRDLEIKLQSFTNCGPKNVICFIIPPRELIYIWSPSRALRTRITEHKSKIRNNHLEAPLTAHFTEFGHNPEDLCCLAVETLPRLPHKDTLKALHRRENVWGFCMNSLASARLNTCLDFSCFFVMRAPFEYISHFYMGSITVLHGVFEI